MTCACRPDRYAREASKAPKKERVYRCTSNTPADASSNADPDMSVMAALKLIPPAVVLANHCCTSDALSSGSTCVRSR